MRDDDRDDPENRPETALSDNRDNLPRRGPRGLFVSGTAAGPGRPPTDKTFRALARSMSEAVLRKLYSIAVKGNGTAAVRAAEVILERGWGRPALEVSGPKGGPIDVRFHSQVRSAIEALIAESEAERLRNRGDDEEN